MYGLQQCLELARTNNSNNRIVEVIDFIPAASGEILSSPLSSKWFFLTEHELRRFLVTHKDDDFSINETWESIIDRAYELYQDFEPNRYRRIVNEYQWRMEIASAKVSVS